MEEAKESCRKTAEVLGSPSIATIPLCFPGVSLSGQTGPQPPSVRLAALTVTAAGGYSLTLVERLFSEGADPHFLTSPLGFLI